MSNSALWNIRSVNSNDISFIYSSFLKSYKFGSDSMKSMRSGVFFSNYREVLDNIFNNADISVACLPDDDNVILGYIIYNLPNTIHYCFVKEAFRKLGIAQDLYNQLPNNTNIIYTHETTIIKKLFKHNDKYSKFIYNPLILYRR